MRYIEFDKIYHSLENKYSSRYLNERSYIHCSEWNYHKALYISQYTLHNMGAGFYFSYCLDIRFSQKFG